jgi:DNA-binding NtrC family response regulator
MAHILVVEDDCHVRHFLCDILAKQGHTLYGAADGSEAFNIVEQEPIDCVITDILMPGVEGIELISGLHKYRPEIKVIAVSGGGRVDAAHYLNMANEFGADRLIFKPFEPQKILDTVDVLLWDQRHVTENAAC